MTPDEYTKKWNRIRKLINKQQWPCTHWRPNLATKEGPSCERFCRVPPLNSSDHNTNRNEIDKLADEWKKEDWKKVEAYLINTNKDNIKLNIEKRRSIESINKLSMWSRDPRKAGISQEEFYNIFYDHRNIRLRGILGLNDNDPIGHKGWLADIGLALGGSLLPLAAMPLETLSTISNIKSIEDGNKEFAEGRSIQGILSYSGGILNQSLGGELSGVGVILSPTIAMLKDDRDIAERFIKLFKINKNAAEWVYNFGRIHGDQHLMYIAQTYGGYRNKKIIKKAPSSRFFDSSVGDDIAIPPEFDPNNIQPKWPGQDDAKDNIRALECFNKAVREHDQYRIDQLIAYGWIDRKIIPKYTTTFPKSPYIRRRREIENDVDPIVTAETLGLFSGSQRSGSNIPKADPRQQASMAAKYVASAIAGPALKGIAHKEVNNIFQPIRLAGELGKKPNYSEGSLQNTDSVMAMGLEGDFSSDNTPLVASVNSPSATTINNHTSTGHGKSAQLAGMPINMVVNSTINVSGSMNDYAEADLTNHISQAAKEAVESAMAAYRQEDNWARFA